MPKKYTEQEIKDAKVRVLELLDKNVNKSRTGLPHISVNLKKEGRSDAYVHVYIETPEGLTFISDLVDKITNIKFSKRMNALQVGYGCDCANTVAMELSRVLYGDSYKILASWIQ